MSPVTQCLTAMRPQMLAVMCISLVAPEALARPGSQNMQDLHFLARHHRPDRIKRRVHVRLRGRVEQAERIEAALLVAGACVVRSWRADVRRNRKRAEDAALAYRVAQAKLQTVVRISDRRRKDVA